MIDEKYNTLYNRNFTTLYGGDDRQMTEHVWWDFLFRKINFFFLQTFLHMDVFGTKMELRSTLYHWLLEKHQFSPYFIRNKVCICVLTNFFYDDKLMTYLIFF